MTKQAPVKHRIDIVAAVRNEERILPGFVDRVSNLELPAEVELGMIFVEDSSTDDTVAALRELGRMTPRLRYFVLRRGFGQCAAIALGLQRSRADAVVMMDADGEHPPELVPEMIRRHLAGADIVQCVRRSRKIGRLYRRLGSEMFNWTIRLFTGVDLADQNVYFRLVSARYLQKLLGDNKWLRFLRISGRQVSGARVEHVWFDVETRPERRSKYGLVRLVNLAVDALLSLVSPARFFLFLLMAVVLAWLMFALGLWPLGVLLALKWVWLVGRYWRMVSTNVLGRLEVVEEGP